jgi:serine/threonine protein kinase
MNEETLFHLACETPPDQRAAFLEAACAGNPALHRRLEAILQAYDHPDSFLAHPVMKLGTSPDSEPGLDEDGLGRSGMETPPVRPFGKSPFSRIGPYKLLQPIGEGGFGTVYMAEQTHPVHRKVALKIIKPGMDSQQVIARFEAERQAWP